MYREDTSKTQQGGLTSARKPRKEVKHYASPNAERCHIRIMTKYLSLCPEAAPAFYLTPLQRQKDNIWYSKQPVGINQLSKYTTQVGLFNNCNF
jgi:hypothetical protein